MLKVSGPLSRKRHQQSVTNPARSAKDQSAAAQRSDGMTEDEQRERREREIAEVEEDLALLRSINCMDITPYQTQRRGAVILRLISATEHRLTDLRRGWKGEKW